MYAWIILWNLSHLAAFYSLILSSTGRRPSSATILRASQFVRDELPIRLAHRVVELENLPHDLSNMPSVNKVKNWYTQSFTELINFPHPKDMGVPAEFIIESDQRRTLICLLRRLMSSSPVLLSTPRRRAESPRGRQGIQPKVFKVFREYQKAS